MVNFLEKRNFIVSFIILKVLLSSDRFERFRHKIKLYFRFHLHWGQTRTDGTPYGTPVLRGSEHTFNNRGIIVEHTLISLFFLGYFSEVHFVHYNTKYASISEAMTNEDGLAVLGYFIDQR